MTALQWRAVAGCGAPAAAWQPRFTRYVNRAAVRVHATMVNPHSILGVQPTADVKDVKRAYRKLALQYHPDVCKTEDGHEKFMALTQAYELLLGRAEGKTDPNHAAASGWDFHDWYWNFRMQRNWEKQHRRAKTAKAATAADGTTPTGSGGGADDGGTADAFGRRAAPHGHAGHQQPEGRANLRSQLAGLRHRAAVRAHRRGPATAGPSHPPQSPHQQQSEAAAAETATGSALGYDDGAPFMSATAASWTASWSWDDTYDSDVDDEQQQQPQQEASDTCASTFPHAPATAAAPTDSDADAGGYGATAAALHNQYTHVYGAPGDMAVHDGYLGTVVGLANHSVPFPAAWSWSVATPTASEGAASLQNGTAPLPPNTPPGGNPHDGAHIHHTSQPQRRVGPVQTASRTESRPQDSDMRSCGGVLQSEEGALDSEPEPFSHPFTHHLPRHSFHQHESQGPAQEQGQYHQTRRRFAASGASREAVSSQLAGLRRKAAVKMASEVQWAHAGVGGGGGEGEEVGVDNGADAF